MSSNNPYSAPTTTTIAPAAPPLDTKTIFFAFDGRIPRRVFWIYGIGSGVLIGLALGIVSVVFGADSAAAKLATIVLYIPLVWINLALGIKRWHDRDKSGWWILIGLIPIIGTIWAFVEQGCLRGTVGPNKYGPDPT